jgi:hypothetical protein
MFLQCIGGVLELSPSRTLHFMTFHLMTFFMICHFMNSGELAQELAS